tara:strand:- start:231 stop:365 length:135 start_codon:yes stop_codon:yes gene_type:complete
MCACDSAHDAAEYAQMWVNVKSVEDVLLKNSEYTLSMNQLLMSI